MDYCVICASPIDYCQGHPEWHRVINLLGDDMDTRALDNIATLVREGRARWVWDPENEGVAALCSHYDAYVVVYANECDFECSLEFEEMLDA